MDNYQFRHTSIVRRKTEIFDLRFDREHYNDRCWYRVWRMNISHNDITFIGNAISNDTHYYPFWNACRDRVSNYQTERKTTSPTTPRYENSIIYTSCQFRTRDTDFREANFLPEIVTSITFFFTIPKIDRSIKFKKKWKKYNKYIYRNNKSLIINLSMI